MGKMIRLKAKDGHELDAYVAEPKGKAKGGIVVVQEIFGVTNHIKRVADQYAAQGYKAIAPAMFDRVERNVTLDYSRDREGPRVHATARVAEHARRSRSGRERDPRRRQRVRRRLLLGRHRRARRGERARRSTRPSRTTAAASRRCSTRSRAARSCITSAIRTRRFRCPTSRRSRSANPEEPGHVYPGAGHGFNCDERGSYSAKDAKVAFERSIEFLREQTA